MTTPTHSLKIFGVVAIVATGLIHLGTARDALDAQASAVALTERASADLAYRGGVAIVTMAEGGLMYEASVGGQKLSFHPVAKGA